jgi:hypothetical protein
VVTKEQVSPRTVRRPERWVISGLTLQAVGVAGVAAYAWIKLRRQGIGGHITAATIRLAWHADVHTRTGLAVLAAGAVIYAAGSILMARPYLSRPVMLFVAVPIAAIVGMLALGVVALVVAILLAALANNADVPVSFGGGHGSRRKRKGT